MPGRPPPAPAGRAPLACLLLLATCLSACDSTSESLPARGTYDEHGLHVVAHDPEFCSVCRIYAQAKGFVVRIVSSSGIGVGVVLSAQGLVVTNAQVVGSARAVEVEASNGRSYVGRIVSTQVDSDLALVAVEAPGRVWPTPIMHDGTPPPEGSDVYVIGHPLGLGWSVTRGIISGYQRFDELTMIQTDAAISPGNSGGAMLDAHGRLIGIVTSKLEGGGAENLAFARPTSAVLAFLRGLDEKPEPEPEPEPEQE